MTCKDCMHYEVCFNTLCYECNINCCDECGIYAYNDGETVELNICEHFKDKSKSIELPCKVGDRLYRPVIDYIREETVMLIIQRVFKDELVVTLHTDYSTYDLKEIGDLYFLTKSEAEQKLKELNANG